ncbi:MAG: hypothetical protein RL556_496 [Actinomycetota bacterium]|jgi:leader peptidase (prepilin peptidase)/N-methyltransferase
MLNLSNFATPAVLGVVYLLVVAWPLAATDIREHRLPNKLVVPSFGFTLIGQLAAVLVGASGLLVLGAFSLGLLVFGLALTVNYFGTLGMGDVKLLAAMAFALGWWGSAAVLTSVLLAFILAGLFVLAKVIFKRARFSQAIALGPYLIAGFATSALKLVL